MFGRQVEREWVLPILEEGLLAPVAALGHVIRQARQDEAREANHGLEVIEEQLISKLAP